LGLFARDLAGAFLMSAALTVLLPVFLDGSGDSNHDVSGPFDIFVLFLPLIDLMIHFMILIDRILSQYAPLTNIFILC
jgi:hypothetical protein